MAPTTSTMPATGIRWADHSLALAQRATPAERRAGTAAPAFGTALTEHMISARWSPEHGWHATEIVPYRPLRLDPATVALHYGQSVFEGLKAFRRPDGVPVLFRAADHGRRFQRSAARLAMPALAVDDFVAALSALVRTDEAWVPYEEARSLYLRPLMFAADASLALRPAATYRFLVVAFVTESFFGSTAGPVSVWAGRDYIRAAPGGTGDIKYGGNYAPTYLAQQQAAEHDCQQVVWLDATERRWVEEMGGMNIFFVRREGGRDVLTTPPLTGTLLPGVTRESILTLSAGLGLPCAERPVSLSQWRDEVASGVITEAFACGTAAVLTPIGRVVTEDGGFDAGAGEPGKVCGRLRDALVAVQRGVVPDPYGWRTAVR
ncbi:branched-chain amino acid aminotransferase [Micromonospora sp. NPDC048843]|uniref:branched-chain amino acid aminotransferase n=1 Tax=Micromonospora sp. NPDC048843 TaxID=3155389 RepID=UPI00341133B9